MRGIFCLLNTPQDRPFIPWNPPLNTRWLYERSGTIFHFRVLKLCDSITSDGNNVIGSINGCTVTLRSSDRDADPGLGVFEEEPLITGSGHFPPIFGSPVINAANDGSCTPIDQLGEHRDGPCHIGANEFQRRHEHDDFDNQHRHGNSSKGESGEKH